MGRVKSGLVVGEVGRGTFVRNARPQPSVFGLSPAPDPHGSIVDLSLNLPVTGGGEDSLRKAFIDVARSAEFPALLEYQSNEGAYSHRAAGADWIVRSGLEACAEDIVITNGAQHAMLVVFSAITRPGDTVLAESLTYQGFSSLAHMLHLRVEGIGLDDEGLRPDLFEQACREHSPRALYCVPTIQNPTATILPQQRRAEIAEIAREYDVALVEDDTYGCLARNAPPPISAMLPETSYYISSLSKSVAPGIRVGFVRVPPEALPGLRAGLAASTWMVPPLNAEVAARWIQDRTADRLATWRREEADTRRELGRAILGKCPDLKYRTAGLQFWIDLPEPWRTDAFVAEARRRGVAVMPAEAFAVGRSPTPHAIRVCVGGPRDHETLTRGLETLAELLAEPPRHGPLSL